MSGAIQRRRLRLLTARLFTSWIVADQALRDEFTARSGWTTKSPVAPTEYDVLFGDVYVTVSHALDNSGESVVAVPVLFWNADGMKLEILTVRRGARTVGGPGSIDIDDIAHNVPMSQVCATLSPNKKWDIEDLDDDTRARVAAAYT